MNKHRFAVALIALAVCAAFFVSTDAVHAAVGMVGSLDHGFVLHYATAGVGLAALRTEHAALVTRAAAKLAEVKDGLAADVLVRIETEHAELVRLAKEAEGKITEAERASVAGTTDTVQPGDAVRAERVRVSEIHALAARHGMPKDFATRHVEADTPIDAVRKLVLDHVAGEAERNAVSARTTILRDEGDTMREAVEAAVQLRAAPGSIRPDSDENKRRLETARAWLGMSILEMGRLFVEETTGERVRGLTKMQLATRLLGMEGMTRAGGMLATSDFPALLANVISKRLRDAYQVAPQNWKRFCRQANAPDFKTRAVVQLSNLPKFKVVKEGGEFQYAGLSDAQEQYALATYGRIVAVTRQALVNDDLSAFNRLPMLLGRAAAETEASAVWAIFTGNPTMNDGVALFHANHGNLGTGGAISLVTLNEARANMRKQKGLAAKAADAEPLNLTPAFLVVSPDNETAAQQFLATTLYPQNNGQVNPFAGSMQQITEARLTGLPWFTIADPAMIDTVEFAYLEGEEGLYTESRIGFEVDGIEIKGRLDFAAKAIDWRGMSKNAGA